MYWKTTKTWNKRAKLSQKISDSTFHLRQNLRCSEMLKIHLKSIDNGDWIYWKNLYIILQQVLEVIEKNEQMSVLYSSKSETYDDIPTDRVTHMTNKWKAVDFRQKIWSFPKVVWNITFSRKIRKRLYASRYVGRHYLSCSL